MAGVVLRRFAASSVTGNVGRKRGSLPRYLTAIMGTTAAALICGGAYYWQADHRKRRQMRLVMEGLGRFARYTDVCLDSINVHVLHTLHVL